MLGWRIKTASFLFLAGVACYPVPARAQESASWGVRLFSEGGWNFHTRKIGKNAATIQQQASNQVVAELKDGPVVGGGIEVVFPDQSMRFRVNLRTTVGGQAHAFLSLCGREGLAQSGSALCASPVEVDARIVEGSVDLVFLQEGATRLLQPMLWLGVGVRSHHFDTDLPACTPIDPDVEEICLRGREIFENAGVNPLLTFGIGLTSRPAPISGFLQFRTVVTGYSGGVGIAEGDTMIDVLLQGGVSVRVR